MDIKDYRRKYGAIGCYIIMLLKTFYRGLEACYKWYLRKFTKIDRSIIVFFSEPDYADNSRALCEYLVDNGYLLHYNIYFCVEDAEYCKNHFTHAQVKFLQKKISIKENNLYTLSIIMRAGYLLGTHGTGLTRQTAKPEQQIIRLWHGCSFKDRSSRDEKKERSFDIALVAGDLFIDTKAYFWNVDRKYIKATGYPRYDWLLQNNKESQMLIDNLKGENKKIILWMPTFRNDIKGQYNDTDSITQFPLMANDSDWYDLDKWCNQYNVKLAIKLHPKQKSYKIPFDSFSNICEITNHAFDEANIPMYSFIALTDALISDYSSIAIDYLVVNKPIAFTLDDFFVYQKLRGFVLDDPREYMPGHHLYKFEDLKSFIQDVASGVDKYVEKRSQMSNLVIHKSNHYCKDLVELLGL